MEAIADEMDLSIYFDDEEPMEAPLSPMEDEMFVDLKAALISSTPSSASTSTPLSREALEHQV